MLHPTPFFRRVPQARRFFCAISGLAGVALQISVRSGLNNPRFVYLIVGANLIICYNGFK
jgi:hypothetical protein